MFSYLLYQFIFSSYYQKESNRGRIYHQILCLSASDNLYVDLLKGQFRNSQLLLFLSFSSPIPSSNQRHQHLIRSNIAATLPCERALSISEIESHCLKHRPHFPNGPPCCPKVTISKSKTIYFHCFYSQPKTHPLQTKLNLKERSLSESQRDRSKTRRGSRLPL